MIYRRLLSIAALAAITIFFFGCSGGSGPVTPDNTGSADIPIIDLADNSGVYDAIGLFGAYEVIVNEDLSVDLTAKRYSSIGEGYIVSGAGFFTVAPCGNCLSLVGVQIDGTNVVLQFMVKHPFDIGVDTLPPSAVNRKDLDVFDLAAVISPIEGTADTSFTLTDIFTGIVVNATGYTKELANVTTVDVALPYVLVIDDDALAQDTSNKFGMGAVEFFDVILDPTGGLSFEMYLTMGYGASAKKMQRLSPKYFLPEFNRCAAWKAEVVPPQGEDIPTQENTWKDDDDTTTWPVTVKVWDWQAGAPVWDGVSPVTFDETDGTMVVSSSEPAQIDIEIVSMGLTSVTPITVVSGTGMPEDPYIYEIGVANEDLAPAGEYMGLVRIADERAPGEYLVGGEADTLVDSPDGVALNWYGMDEYALYVLFTATVVPSCGPITGQVDSPTCPVSGVNDEQNVDFEVSASSANDGDPIVTYEVDWDYDGITFDVDDSNSTGSFSSGTAFNVADPCEDNIPQTFTAAFRATDSCDPANVTIFATCDVTVDDCCPEIIYYTSFDASEGEDGNWSRTGSYWQCDWFNGAITDSNSSCNLYGDPHFYAWRTNGIEIPSCWSTDIILEIQHACNKQETYYDLSGVQYSLNGSAWNTLNMSTAYTQTWAPFMYWEYSWATRVDTANLNSIVNPGDTIWIRFDSSSRDWIGNSAYGWSIYYMSIDD